MRPWCSLHGIQEGYADRHTWSYRLVLHCNSLTSNPRRTHCSSLQQSSRTSHLQHGADADVCIARRARSSGRQAHLVLQGGSRKACFEKLAFLGQKPSPQVLCSAVCQPEDKVGSLIPQSTVLWIQTLQTSSSFFSLTRSTKQQRRIAVL